MVAGSRSRNCLSLAYERRDHYKPEAGQRHAAREEGPEGARRPRDPMALRHRRGRGQREREDDREDHRHQQRHQLGGDQAGQSEPAGEPDRAINRLRAHLTGKRRGVRMAADRRDPVGAEA